MPAWRGAVLGRMLTFASLCRPQQRPYWPHVRRLSSISCAVKYHDILFLCIFYKFFSPSDYPSKVKYTAVQYLQCSTSVSHRGPLLTTMRGTRASKRKSVSEASEERDRSSPTEEHQEPPSSSTKTEEPPQKRPNNRGR